MESFINGLMSLGFLMIFLFWSSYSYIKFKSWIISFLNFMFSIILCFITFNTNMFLSPFIQIFVILINLILFMKATDLI